MNKQLNFSSKQKFDSILLFGFLFLIFFSLVMVSSASISVAERYYVPDFYFFIHHLIYLTISLLGCFLITLIPIKYLQKYSIYCALFGFILLVSRYLPDQSNST